MITPRHDLKRRCPCSPCGLELGADEAMCRDHWERLPMLTRTMIARAWEVKNAGRWGRLMAAAIDRLNNEEMSNEGMGNG